MIEAEITTEDQNVLVFDIENRPLSYWYDGNTTAEVTVIAYKWLGDHEAFVLMQEGEFWNGPKQMLERFLPVYREADVVVGHYIRRHDLPILHGAYIEHGLPGLTPKMSIDTKLDLTRWKDLPQSLEYLADWLGCPFNKFHMTQHSWRKANRFSDDGLALARQRCEIDIRANEWVYQELLRRGLITKPPRVWKP